MKTNFLKIVLPAFALMLAITASLAFTSVEDDAIVTKAWYQNPDENTCILVEPVRCDTVDQGLGFCEIQQGPITHQLYDKDGNGKCNIELFKPQPL